MVFPTSLNFYDYRKGYYDTNPGWYEHTIHTNIKDNHIEALNWLYENINNPEKHCRWCSFNDRFCVKFRYEKNYVWFSLRF